MNFNVFISDLKVDNFKLSYIIKVFSMIRNDSRTKQNDELNEDLQFMLSSIRARENALIFYLQRYRSSSNKSSTDFKLAKNEFQQKQKIYSRQITTILQKHTEFSFGNLYAVRAFWIKLKTIIKVSIQRIVGMALQMIQKLLECYDKALQVSTRCSDSQKGLTSYREVQNIFKKRSIEAVLLAKQANSPSSISYSESKIQKNRSQTLFKPQNAITRFIIENQDSHTFTKADTFTLVGKQRLRHEYLNGLADIQEENGSVKQPKMKSLNRIKNRRPDETIKANLMNFIKVEQLGKIKSTSKASEKYIKKIKKHVERYEKKFEGALDGKYEVSSLLDKKKTIFQNIYSLYDDLFAKNIPNHKMIAKFMFNTTKINQLLYNAYEKKKKQQKKKDMEKEKQKQAKQKDKEKSHVDKDTKEFNFGQKKHKDKESQKQKQADDKQRTTQVKSSKGNRKLHLAKDYHIELLNINTKEKEFVREKKQSEMTAITSKNHTHHKEQYEKNEKSQKDKQRPDKERPDKKILRSKTAKIKLNSQIYNPHLQAITHNFIVGKHFISQQNGQKLGTKGTTEKLIKTIGI